MEYHIITRLIQGISQYQIVLTPKGGNPLYGYSGHWERYKRGPSWEIKVFDSYNEANSYLNTNISVTDKLLTPQVESAKVDVLFGILEEMKTTNHILASLYLDLKKLLLFQTEDGPQPSLDDFDQNL